MDIDISVLKETENTVKFGIFYSLTSLEEAYDGLHVFEVPADLKEQVRNMSKKARSGELSWEALESFLEQHKVA
mgnify:CR=1 FL=1